MPGNKITIGSRSDVLKIVAANGASRVLEYEVREFAEPGSIPNWFPGVILLLRDVIQEDEKIVVYGGIIRIVKKSTIDKLLDWVKGRHAHQAEDDEKRDESGKEGHAEAPPNYRH